MGESYISVPEGVPEQIGPLADSSPLPWLQPPEGVESPGQPVAEGTSGARHEPLSPLAELGNSVPYETGAASGQKPMSAASATTVEENPYKSAMLAQMSAISRAMAIHPPESVEFAVELPVENGQGTRVPALARRLGGSQAEGHSLSNGWTIPAGTILYGQMVNSVSSDHASPIVARVTTGPYQGSHLTGSFTAPPGAEGLVVEFDELSTPEGRTVPVDAVAIDGVSAGASVTSGIDGRFMERYVPAIAASFVSGFAASVAATPHTVLSAEEPALISASEPSQRESLYAGLRDAATLVASDIAANAPKGPRINLESGHPLGILFIRTVVNEPGN